LIRLYYACKMEQSAKWMSSQMMDMRKLSAVCERRIGRVDAIKVSQPLFCSRAFSTLFGGWWASVHVAKGWRIWCTGAWWPPRVRWRYDINDWRTVVPFYQRLLVYQSIRIPCKLKYRSKILRQQNILIVL